MLNMLYNKDFLLKLDKSKNKTIYARITALTFSESPIETIEGRVTGGSVNLDGASSMRRSCSLSIVAQNFDYNNYYWGLNTKFKLEIGLENNVDSNMPDIIWFNMGIYLITNFNPSRNTNNFTINITGKDKMSLLNGEVSGSLESSVDFGQIEEEDQDGVWHIRKIPIPEIIRNMVHVYAGEPYHNIIINDLDTYGLELLEYRYNIPMYLYRDKNSSIFTNVIIENNTTKVYLSKSDGSFETKPIKLSEVTFEYLDLMVDGMTGSTTPKTVKIDGQEVILAKIEYGQTAGYRVTDLVYAGDLIANIGESITSVLDKIKNMLVEFEYFYNVHGQFVFQKKQSFIQTLWTPSDESGSNEKIEQSLKQSAATAYTFSGGELITAFNNNPNLLNMRNDYSVWGERTSASGAAIPVHLRYAIDTKPTVYKTIFVEDDNPQLLDYNEKNGVNVTGQASVEYSTDAYDWREIIFQMAKDYYRYNILDDFEIRVREANPQFPLGQTGYERYYIDLEGFWRQLYYPGLIEEIEDLENKLTNLQNQIDTLSSQNVIIGNEVLALSKKIDDGTITDEEYTIYSNKSEQYQTNVKLIKSMNYEIEELEDKHEDKKLLIEDYYLDGDRKYWNKNVFEKPETLNFWFDFLDTEGELQQFNVKATGARSKAINDTSVKSIYFKETPDVVFQSSGSGFNELSAYRYIQVPEATFEQMFTISGQGKSAKNRLDELIYQHGYCVESVTITTIPVYYLEPNTRIYVYDKDSGIDGDYIVSKINIPLTYNGTMSITATKAAESII